MRRLLSLLVLGLAIGLGAGFAIVRLGHTESAPAPDGPAVITAVRELARLETLEVRLWKKVSFAPEPEPGRTLVEDVAGWVRYSLNAPRGKAIVFADARIGLDLSKVDAEHLRVAGRTAWVVLPPLVTTVVLRPGDTEVIGSNLDSAQTARLLELARESFEREVAADPALAGRAAGSAERAIRGLLVNLGFTAVHFVAELPRGSPS